MRKNKRKQRDTHFCFPEWWDSKGTDGQKTETAPVIIKLIVIFVIYGLYLKSPRVLNKGIV